MKYESVKCDFCKSDKQILLYKKNSLNVVRCKKCGLIYVNPRLSFASLKDMYNENKISPKDYYRKNLKDDEITFRSRLFSIEKYTRNKKGKLLDVGCSIGTFLKVAKDAGWDSYGIDINKSSIETCKKRGLNAQAIEFKEGIFKNNSFDVIVMNDFIEHVPSPMDALDIANKLLKKGGILFIATPNIGSFIAKVSGKRWLHLKPDEHIYYFNKETIKNFLDKTGFKMLKQSSLGRVRNMDIILLKMATYTDIFYKFASFLRINRLLGRIRFSLNPGDEMGVIAKKL